MTVISLIISCLLLSIIPITLADIYVYNSGNKLIEDYDDQPANFGPAFPIIGLKGYLIQTNPKNACNKVDPPPSISTSDYRWIAIIARSKNESCDFDLKVFNAQNANFSGVIIYNYEDTMITMGTHGRNINIPSTMVTLTDGKSLISQYLYNQTIQNSTSQFHIKIIIEPIFKLGAYLIPFVCIIGVSFLGLICFAFVRCYLHRRRTRRHRLPRSALKQLKIKKFVKGDRWEVCAVCLDDFEDGAKLRILPCDHAYHVKCIDPWLLNNRRQCPVCKRYVFPNQDHSDEEENTNNTTNERTPLIQPSNENSVTSLLRNNPLERRILNITGTGAANFAYPNDETLETDDDDDDDGEGTSPQRQSTTNRLTTTDLVFDRPRSSSQRFSHPQLPRIVLRPANSQENDLDSTTTTTTTTTYGSVHDSPSTSFTTPRAANFFVGSLGGTTDNTNISARSVIEDISDIETDDNDERMHSVLTDVEINQAYVPDEESTDVVRTKV